MPPQADSDAAKALRRRKYVRSALAAGVGAILLIVALEWLGLLGWRGDDRRHYEGKTFAVAGVIDGENLLLRENDGRLTPVRLMGIDAPMGNSVSARKAAEVLLQRTWQKNVLVHFDKTATRDAQGRLTAYLYLDDVNMLNTELVKAGAARAHRSDRCEMTTTFTFAETDAKKHKRGIWDTATLATDPK